MIILGKIIQVTKNKHMTNTKCRSDVSTKILSLLSSRTHLYAVTDGHSQIIDVFKAWKYIIHKPLTKLNLVIKKGLYVHN